MYFHVLACDELEGLSLALFTRLLGWKTDRVTALLAGVRSEFRHKDYQLHVNMYVYLEISLTQSLPNTERRHYVYGRKDVK